MANCTFLLSHLWWKGKSWLPIHVLHFWFPHWVMWQSVNVYVVAHVASLNYELMLEKFNTKRQGSVKGEWGNELSLASWRILENTLSENTYLLCRLQLARAEQERESECLSLGQGVTLYLEETSLPEECEYILKDCKELKNWIILIFIFVVLLYNTKSLSYSSTSHHPSPPTLPPWWLSM